MYCPTIKLNQQGLMIGKTVNRKLKLVNYVSKNFQRSLLETA